MGLIGHGVSQTCIGVGEMFKVMGLGFATGVYAISGEKEMKEKVGKEAKVACNDWSKTFPILCEVRLTIDGIKEGNTKKAVINGGLAFVYIMPPLLLSCFKSCIAMLPLPCCFCKIPMKYYILAELTIIGSFNHMIRAEAEKIYEKFEDTIEEKIDGIEDFIEDKGGQIIDAFTGSVGD